MSPHKTTSLIFSVTLVATLALILFGHRGIALAVALGLRFLFSLFVG